MESGSSEYNYVIRKFLVPLMSVSGTALDSLSIGAF